MMKKRRGKKCSVSGPKSNFLFKCKLKHTVSEKRMVIGKERVVTSFLVLSFLHSFSFSLLLCSYLSLSCLQSVVELNGGCMEIECLFPLKEIIEEDSVTTFH